jgi:hypothetical protein
MAGPDAAMAGPDAAMAGSDAAMAAADASASPDSGPPAADWVLAVEPSAPTGKLNAALLGHYDLSGSLYAYDQVPGLAAAMQAVGFSEWRIGLGRWENVTNIFPTLTDGTSCAGEWAAFPAARAPTGWTDFDLMASRDWFRYVPGKPADLAAVSDPARYDLSHVRKAIDVATAFGAKPYVSLDLMPRALSAGTTPQRVAGPVPDPCMASFTNHVSNARPADKALFAAALTEAVRKIVEGSDGEPGRAVERFEFWNEPEYPYFWDKSYEPNPNDQLGEFFATAVLSLVKLDEYRKTSTNPAAQKLKFGLASFAVPATAAAVIASLDTNPLPGGAFLPVDFFSFHAYSNDPLEIVAGIVSVARARSTSTHFKGAELVLAEWGPQLDNKGWDPKTMDAPLIVSTVLALGATAGLDRAHHAIFWDYFDVLAFGLLDHAVKPKPLYHAYSLLNAVVAGGSDRLAVAGFADGKLDAGQGAVLASKDSAGKVRVLLVNRASVARTARVDQPGAQGVLPKTVQIFDDPTKPPRTAIPSAVVTVPAKSLALIEL